MIGFPLPTGLPLTLKLYALAALLAIVAVLGGGSYLVGRMHGRQAEATSTEAKAAKARIQQLADANAQLQDRLAKAAAVTASDQRSVLNLHERLTSITQSAHDSKKELTHVQLIARVAERDRACPGGAAGAVAVGPPAGVGLVGQPGADATPAASAAAAGDPGVDRVPLTLAAVGLYDGALYPGEPGAPELAAVACRTVGATRSAADAHRCGSAAGVFLDQLFAVHIDNAESCAKDRERLGRLIEAVQARERTFGASTP